ncbi:Tetratricopeptide TPR-1 [Corchorus olitorius]|uniref:Tetratricopeptide TPR-1 n=1 Tax=Corchorus olitorius TaxID=93759 RepID=A0A1R3H7G2_9ROSI|nr:Tetratricopeptide TPR-1 [Corchorus olitorius]
MTSDLEIKAKEAFIDDHFELALELYSQAIELNPTKAQLYADRAQANIKLNHLPEAVADANKAIELEPSMSKAYLRKGTACMKLEEYQTAKAALETGALLAPGESRFSKLIKECEERIAMEEVTTNVEPAKEVEPEPVPVAAPPKPIYRYEVMSTKIEIRLTKAEPIQWTSLEFTREVALPQRVNLLSVTAERPVYPSSKPKRVDWDKLEAQVKEEKDEKLDGDAALNKFFRDIYQDADEDTRRAIQKSFVESNGTVLSTNWKEVGAKKVEGSPPDGMEMKKWEY